MIKWWDNRKESEIAWKVDINELKSGFDLDVKNPNTSTGENNHTVKSLLSQIKARQRKIADVIKELEAALK